MVVPLVTLAAAGVLCWLSVFDRVSPLALALVEVESSFGFALWIPFLVAGTVLLGVRLLHARRPPPHHPSRPLTRDAARTTPSASPALMGQGPDPGAGAWAPVPDAPSTSPAPVWLDTLRASARGVSDDPMGRVRFDDAAGVPLALVLTGVTREQARRRVAAYAAWLATIPAPPAARIRVVSSPELEGPIAGLFRGELAKHFPADAVRVVSLHDGCDALFAYADPRWRP